MGSNKKNKKRKDNKPTEDSPDPSLPAQNSNKHGKSKSKSKGKGKGKGEDIITDPRFSSVHWDPRFQNVQKHKAKVVVDSRFDRMFTDKRFGSSSGPIDKRGKRKDPDQANPLRNYYRTDEDEGKLKRKKNQEEEEEETESEESAEELEEDDVDSGESESTTDTDTGSEEEYEDDEAVFEDGAPEIQEENIPEIEKETHRLAIVNLDWNHVKAEDLYMVLRSFRPKGGEIKSVSVYPSEFGLQRMKEEETHGLGVVFDEAEKSDDENDDEDGDGKTANLQMRAFAKSKLRYYFAVVECDSSATADYLYKNCDGVEFERSSNKLDLRFIPDSMEFKHPPHDIATEVPACYTGLNFRTQALQDSKIDIPIDEDDPDRKTLKREFNDKQLAELERRNYITSSESESDESENEAAEYKLEKKIKDREKYRALLLSGDGDGDEDASDGEDEDEGQEMEVTWHTGLEDISKRIQEKKDRESETYWESILRRKRENKKASKNRSKDSSEDESSDPDGEAMEEDHFFMKEPSVKGSKKGQQGKKEKKQLQDDKEAEASRNELELLLADDNGADKGLKGYNMKRKKTKGKKGKEAPEEDKIPDVDLDDPRFSAVFTPAFALDPTDPQFRRSAAYARQVALRQSKLSNGGQDEVEEEREVKSNVVLPKIEKSALVRSLKMKTIPFAVKMSKKEANSESKGKKKERKDKQESSTSLEPVKKKMKTKA